MNPYRNEMEIDLCGEKLLIRASFKGLCEIEQRANIGLFGIMAKLYKNDASIKTIAAVIYGGLVGADNLKMSFDQVAEKCLKHGLIKLLKPCGEFVALAMAGDDTLNEDAQEKKV